MTSTPTSADFLHRPAVRIGLVVAAWVITRAILLSSTFGGSIPLDVVAYGRWADALAAGDSPATDTAFVYPPGADVIFLVVRFIGSDAYFRTFTLVACFVDLLILVSLLVFVWRREGRSLLAPWAWVVMGFSAGPLMYERFDVFAALFGCLAVLSIARPMLSGGIAGFGFLIKLWPEIAILGLPRARIWRAIAVNVAMIAVGWGTLHLILGDSFGFVRNVMTKGSSVEAVSAYPFLVLRALFKTHGVTGQFGSWDVTGPGVSVAATVVTVLGVLAILGIFVLRLRGRLEHVAPGDVVLLGVLIFVASHKINSMQYGVWISAMTAAALAYAGSKALGPGVLLMLMLLVSDRVIWTNFVPFISGNPLMLGYQGLRLALLLAAMIWLATAIWRGRPSSEQHSPAVST